MSKNTSRLTSFKIMSYDENTLRHYVPLLSGYYPHKWKELAGSFAMPYCEICSYYSFCVIPTHSCEIPVGLLQSAISNRNALQWYLFLVFHYNSVLTVGLYVIRLDDVIDDSRYRVVIRTEICIFLKALLYLVI